LCSAISSPKELSDLAELGVLFLLFEMGLELSTDRLRALSRYAFGLGTAQVLVTTAAFVAFAVPFGHSVGTWLLQHLAYADSQLASITSWEEAIVIAVALSLSSSAFVLQLLGDKGQLASRSGSATLGVLLLQVRTHCCHCCRVRSLKIGNCIIKEILQFLWFTLCIMWVNCLIGFSLCHDTTVSARRLRIECTLFLCQQFQQVQQAHDA
jgi:Kef-type K+ transport system membrane component KefB